MSLVTQLCADAVFYSQRLSEMHTDLQQHAEELAGAILKAAHMLDKLDARLDPLVSLTPLSFDSVSTAPSSFQNPDHVFINSDVQDAMLHMHHVYSVEIAQCLLQSNFHC